MKRYLAPVATALFLAACDTYPSGGAYGPQPYPPSYPPADAYPPQSVDSCPISSSRDWRAWIDSTPGPDRRPSLVITGTVVAPTGGYRMEFDPHLMIRESYPVQLVARFRAIPPQGPATTALATHDVRWQWPLQSGPVGSVSISCGNRSLAVISPVPNAQ